MTDDAEAVERAGYRVRAIDGEPGNFKITTPEDLARAEATVSELALVSCDPASLGRDVKLLAAVGYRHERSEVVDTFPHTTQVEAVTRFVRRRRAVDW